MTREQITRHFNEAILRHKPLVEPVTLVGDATGLDAATVVLRPFGGAAVDVDFTGVSRDGAKLSVQTRFQKGVPGSLVTGADGVGWGFATNTSRNRPSLATSEYDVEQGAFPIVTQDEEDEVCKVLARLASEYADANPLAMAAGGAIRAARRVYAIRIESVKLREEFERLERAAAPVQDEMEGFERTVEELSASGPTPSP